MNLSLMQLYLQHKYYQMLLCEYRLRVYWRQLRPNRKIFFACCSCALLSFIGCVWWQHCKREDEKWRQKRQLQNDFSDNRIRSHRRQKGMPPGLYNVGNTCFANCVLQALASCPGFASWISKVATASDDDGMCDLTLFPTVHKLFVVLRNVCGNEDNYSASEVINSLRSHGWIISSGQQDAYEFYQLLNTTLDDEIAKMLKNNNARYMLDSSTTSTPTILHRISKGLPQLFNKLYLSPFRGLIASKMTCTNCRHQCPVRFENFESLILSLDGLNHFNTTLETCLQKWIKTECVADVHCYKCSKLNSTKMYCSFNKELSLAKLPDCLCIQLQRTYYSAMGMPIKNSAHVKFGEYIDLTRFSYSHISYNTQRKYPVQGGERTMLLGGSKFQQHEHKGCSFPTYGVYKLCSVVVHYGEAEDGHYITYRRSPSNLDTWIYTSDTTVKIISKSELFSSIAYLLLYEKMK